MNIEDEDSLAEKFSQLSKGDEGDIDVAVVRLPHISNFTDFNALEQIQGVRVRYIEQVAEMQEPDLILLPGTKNTLEDLIHIRKNGIEAEIKRLNRKGSFVFGICGGYQMLGMEISDPYKTESELLKTEGLGLLNTRTVFQPKKVTTQVEAAVSDDQGILQGLKSMKIKGYEIHMGTTEYMEGCMPYLCSCNMLDKNPELTAGVRNETGNVFGTYIHGIFDNMAFTSGLINNLRKIKEINQDQRQDKDLKEIREYKENGELKGFKDFKEFKEQQYDRLADMLRENLDMEKIYEIVGV